MEEAGHLARFSKAASDIRRVLWRLGVAVSVFAAVIVPAFILTTHLSRDEELVKQAAGDLAERISRFIVLNYSTWDLLDDRLRDIMLSSSCTGHQCFVKLVLNDGRVVMTVGSRPRGPTVSFDEPVTNGVDTVGLITVAAGLGDSLVQAAISSAVGLVLGVLCFIALWYYPFRFIDQALEMIERTQRETERHLLAVQRAQQDAETANRSKSDFLANMSHELRTPLNAVIGFSDALRHDICGALANEKQKEYVEYISQSGQYLLNLINDVLDVSVIEAGKLELHESKFRLNDTVEASIRLVAGRAELGDVEILNEVDCEAAVICADELRIKQILVNLLSNAVKFTPTGGTVSVRTEITDDGSVLICVADTGIGMDANGLAKAVEKFGQAERGDITMSGEGTGLGLPLAKGLVEVHGGGIEIESEPGKGTTVTVRMPNERVIK